MLPTSPGPFLYTDAMPDSVPQKVEVVLDAGELCAVFGDDEGLELIPVEAMAGKFEPALK